MKVIYARKVADENQVSPLTYDLKGWMSGTYLEGTAFVGNRNFHEHISEELLRFFKNWGRAAEYLNSYVKGDRLYETKSEILQEFIPPNYKESYSETDVANLEKILMRMYYDQSLAADALTIVTGKKYNSKILAGCCQGDWISFIYPEENWSDEAINQIEVEFFNLGSEWIIHDGEGAPTSAEEISGTSFYAHSSNYDEVKEEIAKEYGITPEDIVLYVPIGTKIVYGTV